MIEGIGAASQNANKEVSQTLLAAETLKNTTDESSTPARIVDALFAQSPATQRPEDVARQQLRNGQPLDVRV